MKVEDVPKAAMRWVKCNERLPEKEKLLNYRILDDGIYKPAALEYKRNEWFFNPYNSSPYSIPLNKIEWLDENTEAADDKDEVKSEAIKFTEWCVEHASTDISGCNEWVDREGEEYSTKQLWDLYAKKP